MTLVEGDPKAPFSIATTPRVLLHSLDFYIKEPNSSKIVYFHEVVYDYVPGLETCIPNDTNKLAAVVEGDPKAPFSIATTPRVLLHSLDFYIKEPNSSKIVYFHEVVYDYVPGLETCIPNDTNKLAAVVEGDPKAPFSIATTPRVLLHSLDFYIKEPNSSKIVYFHEVVYDYVPGLETCIPNDTNKLAAVVEGDHKAPFSIAITPRCWGGRYSIHWIAPFYH